MTRHRVTITTVVEFDVNPDHYPGATTDEERAEVDRLAIDDDPMSVFDMPAEHTTTVEILP